MLRQELSSGILIAESITILHYPPTPPMELHTNVKSTSLGQPPDVLDVSVQHVVSPWLIRGKSGAFATCISVVLWRVHTLGFPVRWSICQLLRSSPCPCLPSSTLAAGGNQGAQSQRVSLGCLEPWPHFTDVRSPCFDQPSFPGSWGFLLRSSTEKSD